MHLTRTLTHTFAYLHSRQRAINKNCTHGEDANPPISTEKAVDDDDIWSNNDAEKNKTSKIKYMHENM